MKILVPLITLSVVVFCVFFWVFHEYLVASFENEIRKRAETIASTIIYTSDASQDPRQIQRLVTTLNLERDIKLIVAVTGDPPKVFASSRVHWVDKIISFLPSIPDRQYLRAAVNSPKGYRFEKRTKNSFFYITSFKVIRPEGSNGLIGNGALLLEFDVSSFMEDLMKAVLLMATGLVCSTILISLFIYLTIRKYILRPALAMQQVMVNRTLGNTQQRVPVFYYDEIGDIARSLNEMLDQLERESHKRNLVEQRLRESEKKLIELNSNKDKFFSIIAHDLKSPFSAILGFSKILEDEYNSSTPAEQLTFIRRIGDGLSKVYKLIENLLEWSRIQQGGIEFHPETLDIGLIAYEIVNVNKLNLEKKGIRAVVEIQDNISVLADENMVKAILRNLVSNALKFSHPGHVIRIRILTALESEKIPTGFIGVAVIDQGVGISQEHLDLLFKIDSGFRSKGTFNESGTGLGLLLCKEFANTMGGQIWAESEEGKGSTFIFSIPLS